MGNVGSVRDRKRGSADVYQIGGGVDPGCQNMVTLGVKICRTVGVKYVECGLSSVGF